MRLCDSAHMSLSAAALRRLKDACQDFPTRKHSVHGHPLRYFDNAATSLKPRAVLDTLIEAYETCGNIHRGVHLLSQRATQQFEAVREKVASFLHAPSSEEIVFTSGTTASLNLLAHTLGAETLHAGDEVLVTQLEHHSNLLPWQRMCEKLQAKLTIIPVRASGVLPVENIQRALTSRTRLLCVTHASNVNGLVIDLQRLLPTTQKCETLVVVDGAQAVPHLPVDVQRLGCDFYCFSAHKMLGPFGVGVLWGKKEWLKRLPAWLLGGGMVSSVTPQQVVFAQGPHRFEAGTPAIAEVIAFGAAIDYLKELGMENIALYEASLLLHMERALSGVPGLRLLFPAQHEPRVPVVSFQLEGIHPHDVGTALDLEGIAVRAGFHCAEPLFSALKLPGSVRASLSFYNTEEDIDELAQALTRIQCFLR